jgi:hypothetical protein
MKKITPILNLVIFFLLFQSGLVAQTTYTSIAHGNFNDPNNWSPAPAVFSSANSFVVTDYTLTLTNNVTIGNLTLENLGILNVGANTLTISKGGTAKNSSLNIEEGGILSVSNSATIALNGSLKISGNSAGIVKGTLNQSGGSIIIDGNDNNNIATSSPNDIFYSSGSLNQTGGSILIVDPPVSTGKLAVKIVNNNIAVGGPIGPPPATIELENLIIGNGTSTTGNTGGFVLDILGTEMKNLTINSGNTTGRVVSLSQFSCINVKDKLAIHSGSTFNARTKCQVTVSKILENNGVLISDNLSLSGIVKGNGLYKNNPIVPTAFFENLILYGIEFEVNTLNLTNGPLNYTGHESIPIINLLSLGRVNRLQES